MMSILHQTNALSCIFIVLAHSETTVRGQICCPTQTHYPDSDPTCLCPFFLMLRAQRRIHLNYNVIRTSTPYLYYKFIVKCYYNKSSVSNMLLKIIVLEFYNKCIVLELYNNVQYYFSTIILYYLKITNGKLADLILKMIEELMLENNFCCV